MRVGRDPCLKALDTTTAAAPSAAARNLEGASSSSSPAWKSTSELGYREPPRVQADAVTGTTSRRWPRNSTPSSRRSDGDDIASTACPTFDFHAATRPAPSCGAAASCTGRRSTRRCRGSTRCRRGGPWGLVFVLGQRRHPGEALGASGRAAKASVFTGTRYGGQNGPLKTSNLKPQNLQNQNPRCSSIKPSVSTH